ncbi:MAG: antibiotic biosynthesis monooxygenase [Isosphaeraceae bacterium]
MLTVVVHIQVNPDQVEAFKAASGKTRPTACRSLGVAQFDVLQQQDDPTRFVLVEVYRTARIASTR